MVPLGQEPRTLAELFWIQFTQYQLSVMANLGQMKTALDQADAQSVVTSLVYAELKARLDTRYEEEKEASKQIATYLNAAREDADKLGTAELVKQPIPLHRGKN